MRAIIGTNPRFFIKSAFSLVFLFIVAFFYGSSYQLSARAAQFAGDKAKQNFNLPVAAVITDTTTSHLPLIFNHWPPTPPETPILNPIQNPDGDNFYQVTWVGVANALTYTLQASNLSDFSVAVIDYEGPNTILDYGQGRTPASYYYRVKAHGLGGDSGWSAVQSITIFPLHTGLYVRWDGEGEIDFDTYFKVGTHETMLLDKMMDADTIQATWNSWYDPNPENWDPETDNSYYSISTGQYKSSTFVDDPAWKWGYSWKLAYGETFSDGETVKVDGQPFTVHGPYWGPSPAGDLQYWELKNQGDIVIYDDGEGLKQIVHTGEAILRYQAGPYGLRIYDNIKRNVYYQGEYIGYWVQYIAQLTEVKYGPAPAQKAELEAPTNLQDSNGRRSLPSEWQGAEAFFIRGKIDRGR